jgi:hypothetical protein
MNSIRTSLGYSLLATVLAGSVALAAPNGSKPSVPAPDIQASSRAVLPKPGTGNFVERFVRDLRGSGLEVSVGYPMLYTQKDCVYTYPVFNSCYGNNPASPYVIPVVKSWPDEYVDPAMVNGFGRTRPGYSSTYRFDPREAIIVFGRMPPPAKYIGLQTWMYTTGWVSDESPWDEDAWELFAQRAGPLIQYLFAQVPGNPELVQSFSSVDNNINNVVMERVSGTPWDQIRYLVITPDQRMDEAVRMALEDLGVDGSEIFTEGIPETFQGAPVGPLGVDEQGVDFLTLLRYAMPDDEQAAEVWRKSLPLTVLRVRRASGSGDPEPYPNHDADARTAVDESFLAEDLQDLLAAVIDGAASERLVLEKQEPMVDLLMDLGQFGPDCRVIGMNCLGDNQDASYFLFKPKPLDTGKVYAVLGTLATETGNATYVGLSVNDASLLKGVLNISDTKLKGSASGYGEFDPFFVHFFARDCGVVAGLADGMCTTITTDMVPLAADDAAPGDPVLHGMFSAAVRAYVKPGTERGPDSTLQLRPWVLTFSLE